VKGNVTDAVMRHLYPVTSITIVTSYGKGTGRNSDFDFDPAETRRNSETALIKRVENL